jgi:hypothetical protein
MRTIFAISTLLMCVGCETAQVLNIPATNVSNLTYSNDDDFDYAIHGSLKGDVPRVTVSVPASAGLRLSSLTPASAVNQRLARWANAPRIFRGEVVSCARRGDGERETGWIGAVDGVAAQAALFEPVRDYSSVIIYDAQTQIVESVLFFNKRDGRPSCDTLIAPSA